MHPRGCLGFGWGKRGLFLMVRTAALFIDGSNFYHALKEEGQLPFDYDILFSELDKLFDLQEIFFYDAIKDSSKEPEAYREQQLFHERLKNLGWNLHIRHRPLRYLANIDRPRLEREAHAAGIVDSCKSKIWDLLRRLRLIRLTKEKGIDVKLVCDAIELARPKKYQSIILLSGDADFVPAVNLIRSFGVEVINLHPFSGSANELRQACNRHILIETGLGDIKLKTY